jgi:hypothetical protein
MLASNDRIADAYDFLVPIEWFEEMLLDVLGWNTTTQGSYLVPFISTCR